MGLEGSCFWIIGAGRFGTRAIRRLRGKRPDVRITVVDRDLNALQAVEGAGVTPVRDEGASYLTVHMEGADSPDWIIPAAPVHLAFEWVRLKLGAGALRKMPVPVEIEKRLPNPIRGSKGQLYVSYADFVCPDNCVEPFDRCTFTGKPRKGLLYRDLEYLFYDNFTPIVVRSHQLAPGVGGYRPEALRQSLARVRAAHGPILFSTACLCHGVVHAFEIV